MFIFLYPGALIKSLALYTTIYPGVEPYLNDWYRSVRRQTDQDFQLWVGLDSLTIEAARGAIDEDVKAIWVAAVPGDSPAEIRQRALAKIVEVSDRVVLVDSDDVLHDSRVASARKALQSSDLTGCALRLVDEQGSDLGLTLGLPPHARPEDVMPRNNVFGLSNSAFRSDLLQRCLPIPSSVTLVDWFLATRAWLYGARLSFDAVVRMDYRQHGANMARVRPPFTLDQVIQDTERVRKHFQFLRAAAVKECMAERLAELDKVAADIEAFHRDVILQPSRLDLYVQALKVVEMPLLWWSCVAHPSLSRMWSG
jgi:hypothetical protein